MNKNSSRIFPRKTVTALDKFDVIRNTINEINEDLSLNKTKNIISKEMMLHIGKDSTLDKELYDHDPFIHTIKNRISSSDNKIHLNNNY